jgi:hypothetical protein
MDTNESKQAAPATAAAPPSAPKSETSKPKKPGKVKVPAPTIGRIVLATVAIHGVPTPALVTRPAIIVEIENPGAPIVAQVFMKGDNTDSDDGTPACLLKHLSYDAKGKAPNTWRWPDRV